MRSSFMSLYQNRFRVESTRLPNWDYSQDGLYFVTLCVKNRACVLGEIQNGKMTLSEYGKLAAEEWQQTQIIRSSVKLDQWIVMPNHLHGILSIHNIDNSETNFSSKTDIKKSPGLKPG